MYGPNFELVSYSHTVLAYILLEYRLVIAGVGFLGVVVFLGSFIMHLVPLCTSFYIFVASSHGSGQSYGTRMVDHVVHSGGAQWWYGTDCDTFHHCTQSGPLRNGLKVFGSRKQSQEVRIMFQSHHLRVIFSKQHNVK